MLIYRWRIQGVELLFDKHGRKHSHRRYSTLKTVAEIVERKPEKTPVLEPKLFFWDNIISYLASAILGLSMSNIVVDFLRPESNAVACFVASLNNRDQVAYVNNYCNDFLPFAENFSLALVIHDILLLAPHYLWKVYFSARIDFSYNNHTFTSNYLRCMPFVSSVQLWQTL